MLEQDLNRQQDTQNKEQTELSRLGHWLRAFAVADGVLVLFMSFGVVFPSKIKPVTAERDAMPEAYYNMSAKTSPLDIPQEIREPRSKLTVISARNLPLPSQTPLQVDAPIRNVIFATGQQGMPATISPADAEANLTMKKRTT